MNLRFIRVNLYPLWACAVLIAATVCWFAITVPESATAKPKAAESWQLPTLANVDTKKSVDAISARNLWGVAVTASAPAEPEWHVVGIATTGTERLVLLAYEGKPIATLKVGDPLPDDTTIIQIEKDRFFVMTPGKKKLAYGLYKHDPIK